MKAETTQSLKDQVDKDGFAVIYNVFDQSSIADLKNIINKTTANSDTFRKTADLFAIRRFLFEIPEMRTNIFTASLNNILRSLFSDHHFSSKSIYFDKPGSSNWFVAYHQDLTISVDQKIEVPGFGPWTVKPGQFAVQPPLQILENSYTFRIHLDDTNRDNGALRVIRGSHLKGINRVNGIKPDQEEEVTCEVPAGGVMIMKPLIMHASSRTVNDARRRVIHLEFCDQELPKPLKWAERLPVQFQ
ncbi:phytanoyl-CoA dioxygenase family protein [Terrimonas sp. NA20]|uniref:Phytanoyl-CoA dioxygenase family protein n=1 Tax=Terrimonas ginsenosidimutans TaxID=2908004 RepID=A0ABS9KKQ3_9BACT|nr:phytanoyl-CoA dioxygenase family protein [Terrimonas ginsenosidimutans]MCG2612899.1 phytanoyl-CoA dioxygenase family protein [Terrimonas ginsenosidimutans]